MESIIMLSRLRVVLRPWMVLLTISLIGCEDQPPRATPSTPHLSNRGAPLRSHDTPLITPGVVQPVFYSDRDVRLADDAPIIGVVVETDARAYLAEGMSTTYTHVINDMIAGRPVSVTFCNRKNCARAFQGDGSKPLELQLGGFMRGEMALRYDSRMYVQTSLEIPLRDQEVTQTTWGEWRAAHPESKIYLGRSTEKYHSPSEPPAPPVAEVLPDPT